MIFSVISLVFSGAYTNFEVMTNELQRSFRSTFSNVSPSMDETKACEFSGQWTYEGISA